MITSIVVALLLGVGRGAHASRLDEIMSQLKNMGVESLDGALDASNLGKHSKSLQVRVDQGLVMSKAIKLSETVITNPIMLDNRGWGPKLTAHVVQTSNRMKDRGLSQNIIRPDEAIWASETITLPANTIIVIPSHIKRFTMVAKVINFGPNAIVTWEASSSSPATTLLQPPKRPLPNNGNRPPRCTTHTG